MQILAILNLSEGKTMEDVMPHVAEEVRDTLALYLKDVIRAFYTQTETNGVVFMMECDSVENARAEMASLKLAKEGIAGFQLIPLAPLKPLGMFLQKDA